MMLSAIMFPCSKGIQRECLKQFKEVNFMWRNVRNFSAKPPKDPAALKVYLKLFYFKKQNILLNWLDQ